MKNIPKGTQVIAYFGDCAEDEKGFAFYKLKSGVSYVSENDGIWGESWYKSCCKDSLLKDIEENGGKIIFNVFDA